LKTIDISTSHNIVVSLELASLLQRILAWLVDTFVFIVYAIIVSTIIGGSSFLFYTLVFIVIAFYHFLFEVFNNGQTPGKMLLKIRVTTLRGRTPKINDYFMRWMFRMLDILLSVGSLAILFISSSKKNQRIGDIIARTSVVKQRNENDITLNSIKGLEKQEEIFYPKTTDFSDEDMLLLKHCLLRYRQHPNDNNKAVVAELSEKISEHLGVDIRQLDKLKFLDRVLYEYIIQTR